jgi:hypothetical protein
MEAKSEKRGGCLTKALYAYKSRTI